MVSKYHLFSSVLRMVKPQFLYPASSYDLLIRTKTTIDEVGDIISPSETRGIDHLRNPRLNKGLAFTLEERQGLGIHGLQPPRLRTQEEQLELCKKVLNSFRRPINRYLYLTELRERNERLFYKLFSDHIEELLPIVYTPTVGLACQQYGYFYRRPQGLYITINDKGHISSILENWPEHCIYAIVVTDGERILGLGDLGAYGMGIPVGKLALYTALAGIKPYHCLPICLDVGTDNESLLQDQVYIGLKQKRTRGNIYDEFIDEFMDAVVKRYGQDTLIQFEDFGLANATRLLEKYRLKYCTFNDDIQGTAAVSLAGLLASNKVTGKNISDHRFLFFGAGTAALGIADLCVEKMMENIQEEEAKGKIFMIDSKGLITKNRQDMIGRQAYYAKNLEPQENLLKIVSEIKPSVLIGVSTKGGAFNPEILKAMASFNERPIIFALSNPTQNAECTPQSAYEHTEGRVIFCTGSPFPEVKYGGKTYKTGQGNNAYIFPGLALGVVMGKMHHIPQSYFSIAAQTLADNVSEDDLKAGRLFPPLSSIPECSIQIAVRILNEAYQKSQATLYPEPEDKRKYIESKLYNFNYTRSLPKTWPWPKKTLVCT